MIIQREISFQGNFGQKIIQKFFDTEKTISRICPEAIVDLAPKRALPHPIEIKGEMVTEFVFLFFIWKEKI